MLVIKPVMNSSAEEILSFKTCCSLNAWDQNLEIQVRNEGVKPVTVPSFFELEGDEETKRFDTLMPNGDQRIDPGRFISFYCFMEEEVWNKAKRIIFFDMDGNKYPVDITESR